VESKGFETALIKCPYSHTVIKLLERYHNHHRHHLSTLYPPSDEDLYYFVSLPCTRKRKPLRDLLSAFRFRVLGSGEMKHRQVPVEWMFWPSELPSNSSTSFPCLPYFRLGFSGDEWKLKLTDELFLFFEVPGFFASLKWWRPLGDWGGWVNSGRACFRILTIWIVSP